MVTDRQIPRATIILLSLAGAVVVLAGIRAIGSIVGPAVLALVLVIAVAPLRGRLEAWRAPGWVVVTVPLLVVLVVLLGMVATLVVSVAQLAVLVPRYSGKFTGLMDEVAALAARFGVGNEQLARALSALDPGKIFELVQVLFQGLLDVASSLFLIAVLLLAMCLDAGAFARIVCSAPDRRPALVEALATFARKTRRYLLVSTVFGIVCGALDAVALFFLGVPLPLLWGVLSWITNYIPNIGFVVGLAPPALLGLLEGGWQTMLLVIAAYSVINVVVESFIQPKFLGDAAGLSTTVTLLSLIVWAFVLGPLGALLAIPLSLLCRALLIDSDPSATWAAALISLEEPRPPERKDPDGS